MTCIATDGKTMAADSLITADGLIVNEDAVKMFVAPDGAIVGCAGRSSSSLVAEDWFKRGEHSDEIPKLADDDFCALILRPDGRVYWIGKDFAQVEYQVPTAIGSGDEIAIGAMELGATPKRAVEIAARRIATVGGEIAVLAVKPAAAKRRARS